MKKAFTLVELMISIALFSIVLIFLYGAIDMLRKSNAFYARVLEKERSQDRLFRVFYSDILSSTAYAITATKDKEFDIVVLTTKNSVHGLQTPTVVWYVTKDENRTLYRMESLNAVNFPILEESYKSVKVDEVISGVEYFKLFRKDNTFLVYIKAAGKQLVFEVLVPSYLTAQQKAADTNSSQATGAAQTPPGTSMLPGTSALPGTQPSTTQGGGTGSSTLPLPSQGSLPPPPPITNTPAGSITSQGGGKSGSDAPPPPP